MSVATSADHSPHPVEIDAAAARGALQPVVRIFALTTVALAFVFVLDAYLVFWHGWPGAAALLGQIGVPGYDAPAKELGTGGAIKSLVQILLYVGSFAAIIYHVKRTRGRTLAPEAERLSAISAYIARAAFWAVLFIGVADAAISFLRVEGFLTSLVGKELAQDLGLSRLRGTWVHIPLMAAALVVAWFRRSVGFTWLALLVVIAELQIVILRFIFSYEQAFMADLVRFWYAALFLFASAYTLLHEGHVRVDVLYSGFNERRKAWTNAIGAVLLGAPVCWTVLLLGLANKFSTISGPLLAFEVTQAGFGLYVKYLLAGFLLIFALTMLLEFMAALLKSAGVLLGEADAKGPAKEEAHLS